MRKLFLMLAFVAVATVGTVSAQNKKGAMQREAGAKPNKEQMAEQRESQLAQKLSLSDDQTAKFSEINSTFKAKRKALREEYKKSLGEAEKVKTKALVELLSDDQMATYLSIKEKGKPKAGAKAGAAKAGARPGAKAKMGKARAGANQ